jgi:hypothetical protein
MRKEILFAIAAGALFGLIIAFGIWRLNSSLTPKETKTVNNAPSPTPEFGLSLADPNQNQVIVKSPVKIIGITKPHSWIVASGEEEDYLAKSNEDGSFEINVDLIGGVNQILLTTFDKPGSFVTENLTLVFSSQFQQEEKSQEESSQSGDVIRDKVQEKVRQAKNTPYAYLGTVTDILKETLQLKNLSGEIKQAATDDNTSYVSYVNTKKEIQFSDIAIGDFIVAMGFRNGNGVLKTKRVLVTSPPLKPERKVVFGQISEVKGKKVTLKENDKTTWQLDFPKRWKGPEIEDLEKGKNLIAVGTQEENTLQIRSIFLAEK